MEYNKNFLKVKQQIIEELNQHNDHVDYEYVLCSIIDMEPNYNYKSSYNLKHIIEDRTKGMDGCLYKYCTNNAVKLALIEARYKVTVMKDVFGRGEISKNYDINNEDLLNNEKSFWYRKPKKNEYYMKGKTYMY